MRIVITGGTGFIGRKLYAQLRKEGFEVVVLARSPDRARAILGERATVIGWDGRSTGGWSQYADGAYAIVNLAGENIADGRWTEAKKKKIIESRLNAGKAVVEAVEQAKKKPAVVIHASGTGYYGNRGDEICDEGTSAGGGFLADIVQQWECSAEHLAALGVRHAVVRIGPVLGPDGGVLPQLVRPFRLFIGGTPGNGTQWFSWIHYADVVWAIHFLMGNERLRGVFNLTAPSPVMMKDFCRMVGKVIQRPAWFRTPAFLLRLVLGEMAVELLLSGQRAVPKRLLDAGYTFRYPDVESALREILS